MRTRETRQRGLTSARGRGVSERWWPRLRRTDITNGTSVGSIDIAICVPFVNVDVLHTFALGVGADDVPACRPAIRIRTGFSSPLDIPPSAHTCTHFHLGVSAQVKHRAILDANRHRHLHCSSSHASQAPQLRACPFATRSLLHLHLHSSPCGRSHPRPILILHRPPPPPPQRLLHLHTSGRRPLHRRHNQICIPASRAPPRSSPDQVPFACLTRHC